MRNRGDILSCYRLVEVLVASRGSSTWNAVDTRNDQPVGLVVLPSTLVDDESRLARFRAELAEVRRIEHPGVIRPRDVERADGVCFVVTDHAPGKPLGARIPPKGMTLARFLDIALPLTGAFQAAHEAGLLHRDFHTDQVIVDDEGGVRVLHFGFAGIHDRGDPGANPDDVMTLTMTHDGKNSDAMPYLSPEQLKGKPLDLRSDLFSLGAVMYHMASGRHPFSGESSADIIVAILRDEPVPVTDMNPALPNELDRILRRTMSKAREDRPATAAELRRDLHALRPDD